MSRHSRKTKNVLVIDDQVPSKILGSGFPRAVSVLTTLHVAGINITFHSMDVCVSQVKRPRGELPKMALRHKGVGVLGLLYFLSETASPPKLLEI